MLVRDSRDGEDRMYNGDHRMIECSFLDLSITAAIASLLCVIVVFCLR